MRKIRTLIVDDEQPARDGIRVFLERDDEIEIVGACASGVEAVRAIEHHVPDLLFLDVKMPEMDGFDVLAAVDVDPLPVVVFVTAYDAHALRAFDVHALDYVLKPFSDERFETALARAKGQIHQRQVHAASRRLATLLDQERPQTAPGDDSPYLTRLVVKNRGRVFFIKTEEIDWIEAADYYVRLHVGGKTHLLRESLSRLEEQLDPVRFQRIHRSHIVNLDRIAMLEPSLSGDYVVSLQDGTTLKLSRRYRENLEKVLHRSL